MELSEKDIEGKEFKIRLTPSQQRKLTDGEFWHGKRVKCNYAYTVHKWYSDNNYIKARFDLYDKDGHRIRYLYKRFNPKIFIPVVCKYGKV